MNTVAIRDRDGGVLLRLVVQPGASRTGWSGMHGGALKFRVAAPPADGAANDALCAFLARQFGVAKRAVRIVRGHGARHKLVFLAGLTAGQVRAALEAD